MQQYMRFYHWPKMEEVNVEEIKLEAAYWAYLVTQEYDGVSGDGDGDVDTGMVVDEENMLPQFQAVNISKFLNQPQPQPQSQPQHNASVKYINSQNIIDALNSNKLQSTSTKSPFALAPSAAAHFSATTHHSAAAHPSPAKLQNLFVHQHKPSTIQNKQSTNTNREPFKLTIRSPVPTSIQSPPPAPTQQNFTSKFNKIFLIHFSNTSKNSSLFNIFTTYSKTQ
jgi:hypothetical protein